MNSTTKTTLTALVAAGILITGCGAPSFNLPAAQVTRTVATTATVAPPPVSTAPPADVPQDDTTTDVVPADPTTEEDTTVGACPEVMGTSVKLLGLLDGMLNVARHGVRMFDEGDAAAVRADSDQFSALNAEFKSLAPLATAQARSCPDGAALSRATAVLLVGSTALKSSTAVMEATADGGDVDALKATADDDYQSFEDAYHTFLAVND